MPDKNYTIEIIEARTVQSKNKKICIFCHYDRENLIKENTIHYIKSLNNAGVDVHFVNNSTELKNIDEIKAFCKKIMLRENIGYDFGAYCDGFNDSNELKEYDSLILANNSVYGPFYPLKNVFNKFDNTKTDFFGITESYKPQYHIQSYFLYFQLQGNNMLNSLKKFFENFEYIDDKELVIEKYEIGLSKFLVSEGFKASALIKNEDLKKFEISSTDKNLKKLKRNIYENKFLKKRSKLKKIFMVKPKKSEVKDFLFNSGSFYYSWYAQILIGNPFLKAILLLGNKNFYLHENLWKCLIAKEYPDYDLKMIEEKNV